MDKIKRTKNQQERTTAFIYVTSLFIITTFLCCLCLYYSYSDTHTMAQKEFAVAKMERIQSFQDIQKNKMVLIDSIYNKIRKFNPSLKASYEENEIKLYLKDIKDIYEKNSYDARYKIFSHTSAFYSTWFDDRKEVWSRKQNIRGFRRNLEDCEIGLQNRRQILNSQR